jgi:hypothetical protein
MFSMSLKEILKLLNSKFFFEFFMVHCCESYMSESTQTTTEVNVENSPPSSPDVVSSASSSCLYNFLPYIIVFCEF